VHVSTISDNAMIRISTALPNDTDKCNWPRFNRLESAFQVITGGHKVISQSQCSALTIQIMLLLLVLLQHFFPTSTS
jgi:hypothetical protein